MLAASSGSQVFLDWKAQLRSVCGNFDTTQDPRHSLFIGNIHGQDLGGLEVAKVRTNAGQITHLRSRFSGENDMHCFLVFQKSGRQHIHQANKSIELMPGDLALIDAAASFQIEPHGLIENTSIHLSRDVVRQHLREGELFGRLARNSAAGRLIRTLINFINDSELKGRSEWGEGAALQSALLALVAPAIAQGAQEEWSSTSLEEGDIRTLAVQLIEESLQESELSPATIAEKMHISVRRLYRIFEEQGDSVCRFILRRRLERVAHDLSNPRLLGVSITQIAFKWGFVEAAHFSRTFKRQYEISPRDYRSGVCE
ncbi:MAG TPA: transcriptional regulator FeaR [Pseudomonas sp.]|uniref:transcriptional regulator FeaR n=1 Tax=Pseudomonas sp. TaxID=306 RepID=UPI002ED9C89E